MTDERFHMEHLTSTRALVAILAALFGLTGLFAAGTPLTHGTLDTHAVEQLGGP